MGWLNHRVGRPHVGAIRPHLWREDHPYPPEGGAQLLTPFFGACQRIGDRRKCQVGNNNGTWREGIGHGLVPIGHLSVCWASLDRDGLVLEGGIFIY